MPLMTCTSDSGNYTWVWKVTVLHLNHSAIWLVLPLTLSNYVDSYYLHATVYSRFI